MSGSFITTVRNAKEILSIAFQSNGRRAILVSLLSLCVAVAGSLLPLFMKFIIDSVIGGEHITLMMWIGLLAIATTTVSTIDWLRFHLAQTLQEESNIKMDVKIAEYSLLVPGIDHHEHPAFQSKVETLRTQKVFLNQALTATLAGLTLLARTLTLFVTALAIAPILLALPILTLPLVWLNKRSDQLREAGLGRVSELSRQASNGYLLSTRPSSATEILVLGADRNFIDRHLQIGQMIDKIRLSAAIKGGFLQSIGWIIFIVGYGVIVLQLISSAIDGHLSPGDIALSLALASQVFGVLQGGSQVIQWLFLALSTVGQFSWIRDYAQNADDHEQDVAFQIPPWSLSDGITFERVSFSYPNSEDKILDQIDCHIPAGSTVAIVGENGAGKSTFIKLLAKFYRPTNGNILVDGQDLQSIKTTDWRTRISTTLQDFVKFELIAKQSVGVGQLQNMNSDFHVTNALKRAGELKLLDSLPMGPDTQLGTAWKGGTELSGGQWQKVALARSLMRTDPLILILDEPAANLDPLAEHALVNAQVKAAQEVGERNGTITILISHRFSAIRDADLILVFDKGRIVESGSHDHLIRESGYYAELFSLQADGYHQPA